MRCLCALTAIVLSGCASEQLTYERNLHPDHISRHALLLSQPDREQIAHLMARHVKQIITCLCAGQGENQGLMFVYTGPNRASAPAGYGFFTLKKTNRQWHILEGDADNQTSVPCLLCSNDP